MKFNLNGWTEADTNKAYMRADLTKFNNSLFEHPNNNSRYWILFFVSKKKKRGRIKD